MLCGDPMYGCSTIDGVIFGATRRTPNKPLMPQPGIGRLGMQEIDRVHVFDSSNETS